MCEEKHLLRSNKWLHPTGEGWERLQTKRKIFVCEQSKREIEANFYKQRTMNKFWVPMSPKVCGWVFHSHSGIFPVLCQWQAKKVPLKEKPCDTIPHVMSFQQYLMPLTMCFTMKVPKLKSCMPVRPISHFIAIISMYKLLIQLQGGLLV